MGSEHEVVEIQASDEWRRQAREIREAREWLKRQTLALHTDSCPLCHPVARVVEGAGDG